MADSTRVRPDAQTVRAEEPEPAHSLMNELGAAGELVLRRLMGFVSGDQTGVNPETAAHGVNAATHPNYGNAATHPNYGNAATHPNYGNAATQPNHGNAATAAHESDSENTPSLEGNPLTRPHGG